MNNKPSILRRQIIRFVAILGAAMIALAAIVWAGDTQEAPYRAADLRATAAALDERATEIAFASTRIAPGGVARTATSTVEPRTTLGSRQMPVAWGEPLVTPDELEIRVFEVDLDAWPKIQATNQFNDPPQPGNRMVLITVEVTNRSHANVDAPRMVQSSDFRVVGSRGIVYTPFETSTRCGVVPDELDWELFSGATVVGNVCVQAPVDEEDFHLIYRLGGGGAFEMIFFSLVSPLPE